MANIFAKLGKTYGGNWEVTDSERFSENDAKEFKSATVVDSDFGLSVLFMMRNGTQHYVPLSQNSKLTVGEAVEVTNLQVLTLKKQGDNSSIIYRIEEVTD